MKQGAFISLWVEWRADRVLLFYFIFSFLISTWFLSLELTTNPLIRLIRSDTTARHSELRIGIIGIIGIIAIGTPL